MRKLHKKTILRMVCLVLAMVCFGLALAVVDSLNNPGTQEEVVQTTPATEEASDLYADDDGIARVYYDGRWYVLRSNLETILVMGVDDSGEQKDYGSNINSAQADFLLLLILDHDTGSYSGIQLNRDTMTEITTIGALGDYAGTTVAQLALAHTFGSGLQDSCQYTVKAVSNLLFGVEIDHYVALSMDAIGVMNDQVGGVTVTIPVDMTAVDPAFVEGATVTLDGIQAETFVRARQNVDDSTNLSRMKRQQIYMSAWKQAAQEKIENDAGFALESILAISNYMVSDMSVFELSDFSNAMAGYDDQGVQETAGEAVLGDEYMEYYVDEDALYQQVIDLFYQADVSNEA
jgi:LCP family protein required for cell wall assembly